MVSFHQVLAERPRTEVPAELEVSSKKRKWEEPLITEEFFKDHSTIESNPQKRKSIFDIELHLETPFPSNKLQQYLSIQSGIHLCNTRVNMKSPDSKRIPEISEPPSCGQMSLDLELNLTSCESLNKKDEYSCNINEKKKSNGSSGSPAMSLLINESRNNSNNNNKKDSSSSSSCGLITRSPSWLSIEGGDDDLKEMVATVCMRCHMLVMLCKSSPSCPNCKFMHPPDQNPSFLMKRRGAASCVDELARNSSRSYNTGFELNP